MSWDLFVQRLPDGITAVDQIPDDFVPGPIGTRASIIKAIQEAVPGADFSDPSWGRIDGPGFSIEVDTGDDGELTSLALHVRGGDLAICVIEDILGCLGLRAVDGTSPSGLFDPVVSQDGFRRWRDYRNRVLRDDGN